MITDNTELLRRYLSESSEAAFTELVAGHIDLVYSAALRQVDGDNAAAQDITQEVFTDLARKAPRLARHTSLTGWLYTSTRYLASKTRRADQRRHAREQQAYAMTQLLQPTTPDPTWEEVRPVLDEVMHDLNITDREAILMRYFEGRPLGDIGTRLGLTENAARMRVDRALEKLRAALTKRGVTSTAATLGVMLAGKVVAAAPAGLTAQVGSAAFAAAAGKGVLAGTLAWLAMRKTEFLIGGAVAALLAGGGWQLLHQSSGRATDGTPGADSAGTSQTLEQKTEIPIANGATAANDSGKQLALNIVALDSGKPVPDVRINCWVWDGAKVHKNPLQSTRFGLCKVPVPATVSHLILVSESDGFADTRLEWRPDRGHTIPGQYTLQLARSVPIGGRVIDADGQPVAGAQVGFNNQLDAALVGAGPQSDNFGWPFWITAISDAKGQWTMNRIGPQAIRTIYGGATHPAHVGSEFLWVGRDSKAEKQLREHAYAFQLGRAAGVRGLVVDRDGQPVQDAKVMVGNVGSSGRRETTTRRDGKFSVEGCKPGKNLITAQAKGFAATTVEVQLADNSEPFKLTLQPGRLLRLRVVNSDGQPVHKAAIWLNTFDHGLIDTSASKPPITQVEFNRKTDEEGRMEWDAAPDQELKFGISALGYMRGNDVTVTPDGQEHLITLSPALTISGVVRDAASGQPIPRFRIVTGSPERNPIANTTNARWSPIDRFWLSFEGGKFRHVYEEPVVGGTAEPEFMFKIEAEGYLPVVTRVVRAAEKEVKFDVVLRPGKVMVVSLISADGQPVPNADIALVSRGARLEIMPGGFSRDYAQSGGSLIVTDEKGQFKLPPDEAIVRIIAANADGYAEAVPAALTDDPTIHLQPWGRLEGTYLSGGKAVAGRELLFQYGGGGFNFVWSDFKAYQVKTDAEGGFAFPQVPPGKHKLVRLVQERTRPGTWTHAPLAEVEIRAGETTRVTLGGSNYNVSTRLRWPPDLQRETNWIVSAMIQPPFPQPPSDAKTNPKALADWGAMPEVKAAFSRRFVLMESADGIFAAEDVPPGDYTAVVNVFEQQQPIAGSNTKLFATGTLSLTVPADPPSGMLDAGEIVLRHAP